MSVSAVSTASSYVTTSSTSSGTGSTSSKTSSDSSSSDQVANPNGSLSKDDFLQMLITKLKYQDPLSVEDADFAGDMAQYSALEESQNSNDLLTTMNSKIDDMNTNFVSQMSLTNTGQAVSLAGKTVEVQTTDDSGNVTADVTGTVSTIKFKSGVPMLVINGTEYSLSDVVQVQAS